MVKFGIPPSPSPAKTPKKIIPVPVPKKDESDEEEVFVSAKPSKKLKTISQDINELTDAMLGLEITREKKEKPSKVK